MNLQEKELPPLPHEIQRLEHHPSLEQPSKQQHPTLKSAISTPNHRTTNAQIVTKNSLRGSTDSFIRQKDLFSVKESLSARRAGPTLTLNLNSNNSNSNSNNATHASNSITTGNSVGNGISSMGSNNNSSKTSLDFPLISPAQFSASSTEGDCNYYLSNEDYNSSDCTPVDKIKPPMLSFKSSTTKSNIVISQQSPSNIISTRELAKKSKNSSNINGDENTESTKKIEIKSLNRRNFKKLVLAPLDTTGIPNEPTRSPISNKEIKDPERKVDTDALIENIKNLELGLEYEMPICADDLIALKKLGSGQSGTVSKVLHLPTQKTMARKIVHLEAKEVVQSQIMRELRIMHECDSPFIIEFYGTFLHEGNVVICMEYADCGSLAHVFKLTGPFPEFMLKHVAYSVLSGLIYLYEQHRIIHRDVKPSNVLLTSKGKIKLCDFGVSRELINSMADTFVGTSTYMSPERIQGGVYSVKGDVWSLGIMLYELASGKLAFTNENNTGPVSILELLQRIVNEQPPSLSVKDGFSSELSDFISLCLKKESQRPTPSEMMNHPFLADFLDEDGLRVSPKYRSDIRKWAKNVRRVQKGKPIKE